MYSGIVKVLGFTWRLLAIHYPTALQERWRPVCVHTKDVPWVTVTVSPSPSQRPRRVNLNIAPDVVDAQLRLRFLGRDAMLPSVTVVASDSDPAHDTNALADQEIPGVPPPGPSKPLDWSQPIRPATVPRWS